MVYSVLHGYPIVRASSCSQFYSIIALTAGAELYKSTCENGYRHDILFYSSTMELFWTAFDCKQTQ